MDSITPTTAAFYQLLTHFSQQKKDQRGKAPLTTYLSQ